MAENFIKASLESTNAIINIAKTIKKNKYLTLGFLNTNSNFPPKQKLFILKA